MKSNPLKNLQRTYLVTAELESDLVAFFGSRFLPTLLAGAGASSPESSRAAKKF